VKTLGSSLRSQRCIVTDCLAATKIRGISGDCSDVAELTDAFEFSHSLLCENDNQGERDTSNIPCTD
ncbi:MAG TPA: hypothetical protein VII49_01205, partial [Rhizomicrobium sp.]